VIESSVGGGIVRKLLFLTALVVLSLVASVGFCQFFPPTVSEVAPESSIWPSIGTPTLDVSVAFSGSIRASANGSGFLNAAYQTLPNPLGDFRFGTVNGVGGGTGTLSFDARGLWLGATIPVLLTNSLTFKARGEYLFPFNGRITASADGQTSSLDTFYNVIGGIIFGPFTASNTNTQSADLDASVRTRWFYLDAEVAYFLEGWSTSILAGLRYDRLLSTITPGGVAGVEVVPGPAGTVGLPASSHVNAELNSVTPYVGLRVSTGGRAGTVAAEAKGFPGVVFTKSRYKGQKGYFAEFKAEYVGSLANDLSLTVFFKADAIKANFTDVTDFLNLFSVDSIIPSGSVLSPPNTSAEVDTSIQWHQLSVGGSLALRF